MNSKLVVKNVVLTIVVILTCSLTAYSCVTDNKLKEILITTAPLIAAIAVFIQIKGSRDLATGEFVLNLQQEFTANENNSELFIKCWTSLKEDKNLIITEDDKVQILNYLTFFESLYIMVDKNILKMKMLDELFGRRFFVVVNSIAIQDTDLSKNYMFYLNVYRLHAMWKCYRDKNGNDLFNKDDSFVSNNNLNHLRDLQEVLLVKNKKLHDEFYKKCKTK